MSLTLSKMVKLGPIAHDFSLPNVDGRSYSLSDVKGEKGTLIFFICNHCPYVIHINEELVRLANDYMPKGIGFIAINSNDVEKYPEDHPDKMKEVAQQLGYPFVYLFDESQEVARSYDAACTPDFFLYDANLSLVYRGQLDDSRPGNEIPVTGRDLRRALDMLLQGKMVDEQEQIPSAGCNIKWKD